ncbi:MAG: hypothetical protein JWQ09_509 [Segetibacter sp.]|nr:hypothetical protein [Segetibacter sp.]
MKKGIFFDRLGIRNFRSFDSDGIYLDRLSKINLFIGKNNCGKSNVLKLLKLFAEIIGGQSEFPDTLQNQYNGNSMPASLFFKFTHSELKFPQNYTVTHSGGSYARSLESVLDNPVTLEYFIKQSNFLFQKQFIKSSYFDEGELIREIARFVDVDESKYQNWDAITNHYHKFIIPVISNAISNVIYIPDLRFIKEGSTQNSNSLINGSNIISEINKMKNADLGEDENKNKLLLIEEIAREMIGVENLTIEVPHTKDKMLITIDNVRLPLENFGTGIHEIILLCSALIVHQNHLVCLEEPEIHLHPELQRKFLKFLSQTNNQYFITTHSNVFLDYANSDVSIYHFRHDGISTKINRCIADSHTKGIVEDLGFKQSDLLQSNGIIWVEGPSDRAYLNKWISLINPNLKEGIDYTIMFYGGKLLSHFTCLFDFVKDEFIYLLRINKNAYIIMDRDGLSGKINETKTRISKEIGEGHFWVTQGREIENYLSKNIINKWLFSKGQKPINEQLSTNDKIEIVVQSINDKFDYSKNKNTFSKELIQYFEPEDLKQLDLLKKLKELVRLIEKWNE